MAVSWPFDSILTQDGNGNPIYSRTYSSDVIAKILAKYFRNGVFMDVGTSFQVVENSGMTVKVKPGYANINGRQVYEESERVMTIQAASATLPRIDNIVLRLDVTLSGLNIDLYAVTGTAAATPTAPALTRNASVWELCLATISVPAAATSVPQNRITDTRLDSTKCGVVASIIGDTNTSTYYAQIQADLASFRTVEQVVFNDWFAALQVTLSGDVAANLAAQIANLTPTLLWTNPAPSSAFGAQTVSVDLSAYSKIRIETKSSTTRRGRSYDVYIGETAQMDMLANGYVGLRTAAVSASGVVFSGGSLYLSYAGTLTANYDSYAIPTKIFGIK